MRQRNGFLTFLSALFPGVGYMYLGQVKKGVQVFVIFFLVDNLFNLLGMRHLGNSIQFLFWCYTFFDTFNLASKYDKGEPLKDWDFIFLNKQPENVSKSLPIICAWALIGLGTIAIVKKTIEHTSIYNSVIQAATTYFLPIFLIIVGLYMLFGTNGKLFRSDN